MQFHAFHLDKGEGDDNFLNFCDTVPVKGIPCRNVNSRSSIGRTVGGERGKAGDKSLQLVEKYWSAVNKLESNRIETIFYTISR